MYVFELGMIKEDIDDVSDAENFLSQVKIFQHLDAHIISSMVESMDMYRFDEGELLIEKNKPGKYMLLINQGRVVVDLGQKKIPLPVGSVVGEMSLLSGQVCGADVIAESPIKAYALHRYDFQNLMAEFTDLATVMSELMNSRAS